MEFWIGSAIGVIVGSIVTNILYLIKRTYGTLKIDHSNPAKDVYRIHIDDLEVLSKKNRILLKVDNDADFSQE